MSEIAECCRECHDKEPPRNTPADFILWGKFFPPVALGPRCYEHAAKHIGWMGRIDQYAVYDLRKVRELQAKYQALWNHVDHARMLNPDGAS